MRQPYHPLVARFRVYLAELWIETGDLTAAEKSLREALSIYRAKFPPGHPAIGGVERLLAEVSAAR